MDLLAKYQRDYQLKKLSMHTLKKNRLNKIYEKKLKANIFHVLKKRVASKRNSPSKAPHFGGLHSKSQSRGSIGHSQNEPTERSGDGFNMYSERTQTSQGHSRNVPLYQRVEQMRSKSPVPLPPSSSQINVKPDEPTPRESYDAGKFAPKFGGYPRHSNDSNSGTYD